MASPKETFTAKWTEPLTNLFVNILVEEVKKGNRTSSSYNKAGWKNIQTEFNKRVGLQYNQVQLKNKVNKLKKQYSSFKKLLSQSGFGWDAVNKAVTVHDPSIWELHIKNNSEWAKFKDGFAQYNELCIVFGDTYTTREFVQGNDKDLIVSEEDDNGGSHAHDDADDDVDDYSDGDADDDVDDADDDVDDDSDGDSDDDVDVANTCKALQELIKSTQEVIKSRASPSMNASITSQATPPPVDPFSISAVIDILVSMPELEQDLYNKAVERACISATWREAFISSPIERRNGLLRY